MPSETPRTVSSSSPGRSLPPRRAGSSTSSDGPASITRSVCPNLATGQARRHVRTLQTDLARNHAGTHQRAEDDTAEAIPEHRLQDRGTEDHPHEDERSAVPAEAERTNERGRREQSTDELGEPLRRAR